MTRPLAPQNRTRPAHKPWTEAEDTLLRLHSDTGYPQATVKAFWEAGQKCFSDFATRTPRGVLDRAEALKLPARLTQPKPRRGLNPGAWTEAEEARMRQFVKTGGSNARDAEAFWGQKAALAAFPGRTGKALFYMAQKLFLYTCNRTTWGFTERPCACGGTVKSQRPEQDRCSRCLQKVRNEKRRAARCTTV